MRRAIHHFATGPSQIISQLLKQRLPLLIGARLVQRSRVITKEVPPPFVEREIKPHKHKAPGSELPGKIDCLVTTVTPLMNQAVLLAESGPDFAADVVESVLFCCLAVLRPALALEVAADFFFVVLPPRPVAGVERLGPGDDSPPVVDGEDGPPSGELKLNCSGTGPSGDDDDGSSVVSPGKGLATFSVIHPAFFSFSADCGFAGDQSSVPGITITPPTSLKAETTTHSLAAITGCTGDHPAQRYLQRCSAHRVPGYPRPSRPHRHRPTHPAAQQSHGRLSRSGCRCPLSG